MKSLVSCDISLMLSNIAPTSLWRSFYSVRMLYAVTPIVLFMPLDVAIHLRLSTPNHSGVAVLALIVGSNA